VQAEREQAGHDDRVAARRGEQQERVRPVGKVCREQEGDEIFAWKNL
jgi:hypothetical protein